MIHAGTLNAHVGCVAASLKSLELLGADDGAAYRRLYELGGRLRRGLADLGASYGLKAIGPGPVFHAGFVRAGLAGQEQPVRNYRDVARTYDTERYSRFVRAIAARGVRLIGRGIWYLSTSHTDSDLDQTLAAARAALAELPA